MAGSHSQKGCLGIMIIAGSCTGLHALESTPSFQGLGDLGGGVAYSEASDVSSDGSVVTGISASPNGNEAFRWTEAGGMTGMGDLPNYPFLSGGIAVSGDGGYFAGHGSSGVGRSRAVRWNSLGQIANLGALGGSGFVHSTARGISGDGAVVVGNSTSSAGFRAFRWSQSAGMQNLGVLPATANHLSSGAMAISTDGSTIVGWSAYTVTSTDDDPELPPLDYPPGYVPPPTEDGTVVTDFGMEAFRWTQAEGMIGLGDLGGGALGSEAVAISENGSFVAGRGRSESGTEGVIWSPGGMTSVGDLPGGDVFCRLRGVTNDGLIAIGESSEVEGESTAVLWDDQNGLRKLEDVLAHADIAPSGWTLSSVTGISGDASVLVGNGTNPEGNREAWMITDAAGLFEYMPPPVPPGLQESIRIDSGYGVKFPTQPGNLYQLQGRIGAEGSYTLYGDIHSTMNAAGNGSFILPRNPGDISYNSFQINRLEGSDTEGPFTSGASIVQGTIVRFTTEPGHTYQVQTSGDLSGWSDVGDPADPSGNSGPVDHAVIHELTPPPDQRFYRVEATPVDD